MSYIDILIGCYVSYLFDSFPTSNTPLYIEHVQVPNKWFKSLFNTVYDPPSLGCPCFTCVKTVYSSTCNSRFFFGKAYL